MTPVSPREAPGVSQGNVVQNPKMLRDWPEALKIHATGTPPRWRLKGWERQWRGAAARGLPAAWTLRRGPRARLPGGRPAGRRLFRAVGSGAFGGATHPPASTRPPRVSGGGRDAHDRPLHSRPAGSPRLAWESDFIAGVRAGNRGTRFGAVQGPPSPRVRGAGSPPTRARPRKRRRRARGHAGARRGGAAVPAAPPHGPGPRGEAPRTERGPGTRAKRTRRPRSRVTEGRRGRERAARQHAVASRVSWVRVARGTARGRRKWPRRKPGLGAACALG